MEWSPGLLLGIGIGIAIAGLVVIAAIARFRASARKREAERIGSLVEALSASGFSVTEGAEIPTEAPDWEIAPRRNRTDHAIRVERSDATAFVFDHTQINKGYMGWNQESSSGGDSGTTRTYTHTVACLHAPGLATASFQVIPNLRTKMSGFIDASARDIEAEGHTKTAGALGMLMGMVSSLAALHERPGALTLADHPELTTAFNIYGEDESAVGSLLTGPLRDRLVSQPGVILEAEGPWLIATFNVGLAFGNSDDKTSRLASGLLSPEQTVRLVELAFELRDDLS